MPYSKFLKRSWDLTEWAKEYAGCAVGGTLGDAQWAVIAKREAVKTYQTRYAHLSSELLVTDVWVCTFIHDHNSECLPNRPVPLCQACPSDSSGPSSASTLQAAQNVDQQGEGRLLPSTSRAMQGPDTNYYAREMELFGHKHGVDIYKWTEPDLTRYLSRTAPGVTFTSRTL